MRQDSYVGQEILDGQFKIIEKIGSGGMGAVYKAHQPSMNRFAAVKILHARFTNRKDLVARFRREARAMSHLTHPNTVKVFLYGNFDDNSCYIVMEYLEGRNLGNFVRHEGPMDPVRAIAVLIQACGALEEAHQKGIIHRDLKPENIFLCKVGGLRDFVKVLDFGLAKVSEREMQPGSLILTQEGMVFGTPEFMSPEQAQGKTLDPRSDVYSLAVILYELVTGQLPFDARSPMEFITLHVSARPIPLAERAPDKTFPAGFQEVLDRAMAKDPDERYQSAAEFAQALGAVAADDPQVTQALSALPANALAATVPIPSVSKSERPMTPAPSGEPTPDKPVTGEKPVASERPAPPKSDGAGAFAPPPGASSTADAPKPVVARQGLPTWALIGIGVLIGLCIAVAALKMYAR